jgi:tRNA(Arg) A34 adenosine deaminase TadA
MTKLDDDRFMAMALEEAQSAQQRAEVPIGAVLVDADGVVLARAGNRTIGNRDPTAHAEMLCIREASQKLRNERLIGTTLYVTL